MNARTSARRAVTSGLSASSVMRESLHVLEPGSQVQNAIYLAGGAEWPVSPDDWEAARARAARAGTVRLRRRRRRLGVDGPCEPRGVRAPPAAAADARRDRGARPVGRGARAALAGAVPARARRRPLDRPRGGRARRRPRLEGDRRADDPLERRVDLARGRRRRARRRAALVPALLVVATASSPAASSTAPPQPATARSSSRSTR